VCSKWLAGRRQQAEQLSWRAHSGPVYALALLQYEGAQLLATAGGDGCVRLWRVDDVLQAAAAVAEAAREAAAAAAAAGGHDAAMSCEDAACSSSGSRSVVQLQPTAEVLLPHLQNPLGLSFEGGQPAAQALAVDTRQQQLFMGERRGVIAARQPDACHHPCSRAACACCAVLCCCCCCCCCCCQAAVMAASTRGNCLAWRLLLPRWAA
jgi:hypothetical protein